MTALEFRAILELDIAWRKEEISFLRGLSNTITVEEKKAKYRKTLILSLYSHFEGFINTTLLTYVDYLNKLNKKRNEFTDQLITASMENTFKEYDNLNKKSAYFKKKFPEEVGLHRFSRRTDLICQFNNFLEENLKIPDSIVNTESNLWYDVLEKNLYKLGIGYEEFKNKKTDIDTLLKLRNNIAHTGKSTQIKEVLYTTLENKVFTTMERVIILLYEMLKNENYKKK